jgi:hypothetical protein
VKIVGRVEGAAPLVWRRRKRRKEKSFSEELCLSHVIETNNPNCPFQNKRKSSFSIKRS